MHRVSRFAFVALPVILPVAVAANRWRPPTAQEPDQALDRAAAVTLGESRTLSQLDYIMTAKIRFLFFWKGFDDVGGGYIRRSTSVPDPRIQLIQVLFGSDPEKAPRRINKWGTAFEAISADSSAFFGFMTDADPDSADDAEAETREQAERGEYGFRAIVSHTDSQHGVSQSMPLSFHTDFNFRQVDAAQDLVLQYLTAYPRIRTLELPERNCDGSRGFLQAVDQLVLHATSPDASPKALCYVYNARNYTLTLKKVERREEVEVEIDRRDGTRLERVYSDVIRAEFETLNDKLDRTSFSLLLGSGGTLIGVPVQIVYQPNFWFKIELNLEGTATAVDFD